MALSRDRQACPWLPALRFTGIRHRHTDEAAEAGILSLPACLFSPASFKGNPKAQAGRALGEEQEQVQVQGSATAAPPLCRPQAWTIPSRPPRAAERRANDES
jgi:hypothetical protein